MRPPARVLGLSLALCALSAVAGPSEREQRWQAEVAALMQKAEAGDVEAQFAGGMLLLQGRRSVEKDTARGLGLLERAAESGDKRAMLALYETYAKGHHGVPVDEAKAEQWAARAGYMTPNVRAAKENEVRQEIGRMAAEGDANAIAVDALIRHQGAAGAEHDPQAAIATLEKQARDGDKTATALLYGMHREGRYEPGPEIKDAFARQGLLMFEGAKK